MKTLICRVTDVLQSEGRSLVHRSLSVDLPSGSSLLMLTARTGFLMSNLRGELGNQQSDPRMNMRNHHAEHAFSVHAL